MDLGDWLERGETKPLLDVIGPAGQKEERLSSEIHEVPQLQNKPRSLTAPTIIIGYECLESIAFYGICTNLVIYLRTILHESNASSASNASSWNGTSFFTPLLAALIADTYWGNYQTVFVSSLIYLLGLVIITSSALVASLWSSSCLGSSCQSATVLQNLAFFSGLYLVAFGSGGVKAALLPLGADQFDDNSIEEREKKGSFFNWFYVCITSGSIISGTLIVWIQENVDWALGFGISTACITLAFGALVLGRPTYRMKKPNGSPLKRILQVLVASFRKMNLEVPNDSNLLYEVKEDTQNFDQQRLRHTDEFRFLDKAAIVLDSYQRDGDQWNCWNLCTITEVEELKILLRLLSIWMTGIIFSAAYAQISTTFIQQGSVMDTSMGSFSIPPASLSSFEVISVMAWVVIYNKIIVPVTKKVFRNSVGLSQLERMGIGRFMISIAMAIAAVVETRRLESVESGKPLSLGWQLPQYFLLAASEVFNNISQLEFFYDQAPDTMKSMCTSFALVAIALGNYLSSFIITFIQFATKTDSSAGWMPDDLNNGHLDYFFWVLAGISAVNFILYLASARSYTHKQIILRS